MGAHKHARGSSWGPVGSSRGVLGCKRGFTLIELLVVIGIIAVLAAIIIPVYARAQERARQAHCIANMHAIAVAIKMYQMDYRASPLPYDPKTGSGGVTALYLSDYLSNAKSLRCPDDQTQLGDYMTLYAGFAPIIPGTGPPPVPWDNAADNGRYYRDHYSSYNCMPGVDPTVVGSVATVPYQLYNYYGCNLQGLSHLNLVNADADASRRFTSTSAKFAGLSNAWAPDETIVTHCPYHRDYFGNAATWQDVIVRVGGDAALMRIANYDWVNQPPQ